MSHYSLNVVKNNQFNPKNSMSFETEEELEVKYNELREKYKATEDADKSMTTSFMGSQGFFKIATGQCKHEKKVELQSITINY